MQCYTINNLACSSRTGQYFSFVLTVWTLLHSFCTATTLGQTSPYGPAHRLSFYGTKIQCIILYVMLYVVHVLLCTVLFGIGRGRLSQSPFKFFFLALVGPFKRTFHTCLALNSPVTSHKAIEQQQSKGFLSRSNLRLEKDTLSVLSIFKFGVRDGLQNDLVGVDPPLPFAD